MRASRLIAAICAAEILTMAGVFAFPALLPVFFNAWGLSNTEAGWIAGIYFAGYAVGAPILLTLTDRIDARYVYLFGAGLAALTSAGFALIADGFWSAMLLRFLAGVGLAATYMPGLKLLIDRYPGEKQSRAVALYTSSFSLGTAVSYLMAGEIEGAYGWQAAFMASAAAAIIAILITLRLEKVHPERPGSAPHLFDFRPVFASPRVMSYVLAYGAHCWELFALRSWMVAFLAASLVVGTDTGGVPIPTTVAMLTGLVAWVASIGGNELCVRFGRMRVISLVMIASSIMAFGVGFTLTLPYPLIVALMLVYTALVQLDSGALTAGVIAVADPSRRGATMAVHAVVGFGCAGIGPLVFGVILDLAGGQDRTPLSWGLAFVSMGVVGLTGPLMLRLLGRERNAASAS